MYPLQHGSINIPAGQRAGGARGIINTIPPGWSPSQPNRMKNTVLTIKLHRPVTPSKQVNRQRLIQGMNTGLENGRLLTLVSAPAGFGKTTCVQAWLSQLALPAAWLSLDPADDDPGRFLSYFIAALQQVEAGLGKAIENALTVEQLPPVDWIATALIHDLLGLDRRMVFVLDDFHVIQDALILKILETIIANQPPQLHFVLVTREDPLLPLARLRANNLLTEVRSGDLRFSSGEINQFFQEVMEVPLSAADILRLEQRTEGWAAGLQLAGLSLQGRNDPSGFIANLSGSHRHIVSYLTEEVLGRQGEDVQTFLLQTAILEKLNGELCDAVTGRTDSSRLLERLLHANLFLIPLDDEQRWYRYHHLFADSLRALLSRTARAAVQPLHQRASQWFAAAGMAAEAIEHALAAQDFGQAVDLMEQHAMGIVMQGYVKTVEGWFRSVPAEWNRKSPRASLALAGMYLLRGNYGLVEHYLQQAEPVLHDPAAPGPDSLRSEWYAIQSNLANIQGKAAESMAAAQQALQAARPDDDYIRGIAYLGLGGAYRLTDDYPNLVAAYQNAIQHSRIAGKPLPEMLSTTALALMAIRHGELRFAEEVTRQAIHRLEAAGVRPPPVAGSIFGALGMVCYEWNRLDEASRLYQQAFQLNQLGGHNAGVVFAHVLHSRLRMAEGNLPAAVEEIQRAAGLLPLGIPAWLRPEFTAQQARVELARGSLAAVRALRDQLGINGAGPIPPAAELDCLTHMRCLLFAARQEPQSQDLSEAFKIASRLIEGAQPGGRMSVLLPALLLRARMHVYRNDRPAALDDLARALAAAIAAHATPVGSGTVART
ncbi:MAG TPA: hypothetical protein VFF68_05545, partial [Anaerolineaceae bacterium]|nr:hypothetical protein [Anaerolineaceae bacterium]